MKKTKKIKFKSQEKTKKQRKEDRNKENENNEAVPIYPPSLGDEKIRHSSPCPECINDKRSFEAFNDKSPRENVMRESLAGG